MTTLDDIGQNIKGKTQVIKGKLQKQSGRTIEGNIEELKGETNQVIAHMRMQTRTIKKVT